ncbi:autotransporter outer membrane beta-barrel domain-containing protein, partial [Falsochrobactrum sp. TDYN1]
FHLSPCSNFPSQLYQSAATGQVSVAAGATFGGSGTVGGNVVIASNGILRSYMQNGTGHALTVGGNLTGQQASLNYDFGGSGGSRVENALLVTVHGDVDVTGATININSDAPLAAGKYHLVKYDGTVAATGLVLGDDNGGKLKLKVTDGTDPNDPDLIELISTAGLELRFWDATDHDDGHISGGTGVWQAGGTLNNWTSDDGASNGAFSDNSFAVFEGTAGTVSVDNTNGAIDVTGMQFATNGYIIQNGTITLAAGTNHFRVGDGTPDSSITATIASNLAGDGQLEKTDPGTLKLAGNNSYTGGTVIGSGVLNIVTDSNLGAPTGAIKIDEGTLQFGASVTSARAISLTTSKSAIDTEVNGISLSGVISGAGLLNKYGTGILTLTGTNTYTGGTSIETGTLSIASDANLGGVAGMLAIGNANLAVSSDTTLARPISLHSANSVIDTQAHQVILSGVVSHNGTLNKHGSGTLTLTGQNVYSGGTHIAAGTLIAASDENLGNTNGQLTIDNATFKAAGNFTTSRSVTLTSASSNIDTDVHNVGLDGTISGNGALNKKGTGKLSLRGTNTFTGGVFVTGGILDVSSDANLGDAAGKLTLDGGTLETSADFSSSRQMELGAGNGVIDVGAHTGQFGGVISGAGNLTIQGGGTAILAGANTYTGTTTVQAGELQIDGDQTAATGLVNVAGGASLAGKGTIGGSVNIAATGKLRSFVDESLNSHALNIIGNLTANNSHLEYDYGSDALHNTITVNVGGNIDLSGAQIDVAAAAPMAAGVYHLVDYAGSKLGTDPTLGTTPGAGFSLRLSDPNSIDLIYVADKILHFWNPGGTGGGTIDGGAGVWETGGTLNNWTDSEASLNGNYSNGAFAVFEGQSGTVTVDDTNGAVNVSGMQFITDGYIVEGGAITLLADDNDIRVGDGSGNATQTLATINSELTGAGRLQKADAGILVLKGTNTYTGGTSIKAGTLRVSSDVNLGDAAGDISIGNGTLQYDSSFDTARAVSVLSPRSTIDTQGYDSQLSGVISGAGGLIKTGTGSLTLSGQNSFTDRTIIQEGTLALAGQGTLASSDGITVNAKLSIENIDGDEASIKDLAGAGTGKVLLGSKNLTISDGQNTEFAGEISGAGKLHIAGGSVILSGANTYEGGTAIDAGAHLQVGTGGTTGNIAGPVDLEGILDFNKAGDIALENQFNGTGTLNLTSGGTTTFLTASPDFHGTTNLLAGELVVNLVHGGQLNINENTVLSGTGTVGAVQNMGTIMPGGSNTTGTLTVTGDYEGDNGTLIIETTLGDDTSATDHLKIAGDTSGNTTVVVHNMGGAGAQTKDGIRVISIGGQAGGVFHLDGDYVTRQGEHAVIAGAYAYTLNEGMSGGSDNDWYLRSQYTGDTPGPTPPPNRYNPAIPLYTAYGQILNNLNQNMTTSLRERVGQRLGADTTQSGKIEASGSGSPDNAGIIWGRIDMAHSQFKPSGSTTANKFSQDIWKVSAGIDGQFVANEAGELFGSLWLNYAADNARISSPHGAGKVVTDGYGVGGALTWYGNAGWYVDTQAHLTWYDTDFESHDTRTAPVTGQKAFGYGVSIEAGQDVKIDENWSLTPQMQLIYSSVQLDSFTDSYQAAVRLNDMDSLVLRAGLSANYRNEWKDDAGGTESLDLYGITNIYRELLPQSHGVEVSSVRFQAGETDRTWLEIGAGGTHQWANSRFALYGNATLASGLDSFGDNYRLSGKIGLKTSW